MENQIVVWGENSKPLMTSAPQGATGFLEVLPGGATQTIAIRTNHFLELWPTGAIPPLSYGPSFVFPQPVIGGAIGQTCFVGILPDYSLLAWGAFQSGNPANPPTALRAKSVAVGSNHGCAIDLSGALQAWGDAPITPPPPGKFKMIRARSNYTIGLRENDDRFYGWGGVFQPPAVLWAGWKRDSDGFAYAPGKYYDLAAGPQATAPQPHILALDAAGAIHGWGQDEFGQATAPGQASGKFISIGAGLGYSIALDENEQIHHWGKDWGGGIVEVPGGLARVPGLATGPGGSVPLD